MNWAWAVAFRAACPRAGIKESLPPGEQDPKSLEAEEQPARQEWEELMKENQQVDEFVWHGRPSVGE
jgi:hypothetical protein